jgi:hypothetical protein
MLFTANWDFPVSILKSINRIPGWVKNSEDILAVSIIRVNLRMVGK